MALKFSPTGKGPSAHWIQDRTYGSDRLSRSKVRAVVIRLPAHFRGASPSGHVETYMNSCFQALEKAAEHHRRFHRPKAPDGEHRSFFDVPFQPAGNLATQRLFRSGPWRPKPAISQPGDTHEQKRHGIGMTSQRIQEVEGEQEYIGGVLATFEGPECNAFRGSSVCNLSSGNYEIVSIDDTCCSKGCTRKHEERHVRDLFLCCWRLSDNIQNHVGTRDELIEKHNEWMAAGARNWSECNAYGVSVQCAKDEMKEKNCDKNDTQCCRELKFYLSEMKSQQRAYCEIAPKTLPPCPFGATPGPK